MYQIHNTFEWFTQLRWWANIVQIIVFIIAKLAFQLEIWTEVWIGVFALLMLSNVYLSQTQKDLNHKHLFFMIILDIILLTLLLMASGGPSNPFTILYLVNVSLAAITLQTSWIWITCVLANLCFVSLFFIHVELAPNIHNTHHHHAEMMNHSPDQMFSLHIYGMLIAFILASILIAYFISKVSISLKNKDLALAELKNTSLKNEQLAALTTLAAGAAHELNTPLSTIHLINSELIESLDKNNLIGNIDDYREDLYLMKSELLRCKEILEKMNAQAGNTIGEIPERISIKDLVKATTQRIKEKNLIAFHYQDQDFLITPIHGLIQALIAVIQNAIYAVNQKNILIFPTAPIDVTFTFFHQDQIKSVKIEIKDQGIGIEKDHLNMISKPFFSTKEVGEGMGLGLFLTRTFLEKLNGSFEIQSESQKGTSVQLIFPQIISFAIEDRKWK
jgi:two-component system sensor histidine kinase RegB